MQRPHHSYIQDNMVVLETHGPWDAKTLKQLIDVMAPVKSRMEGNPWGMLLVLLDDAFLLSDTVRVFTESVKKDKTNGRKATAIVLENDIGYEMSKSLFERVFKGANEPHAFFNTTEEAQTWLENKINDERLLS